MNNVEMCPLHISLNESLTEWETILNVLDGIPYVNLYSIPAGFLVACIQAVAGAAIFLVSSAFKAAAANAASQKKWQQYVNMGFEHMCQGAIRASHLCTIRAGLASTIIFSPLIWMSSEEEFRPYIPYETPADDRSRQEYYVQPELSTPPTSELLQTDTCSAAQKEATSLAMTIEESKKTAEQEATKRQQLATQQRPQISPLKHSHGSSAPHQPQVQNPYPQPTYLFQGHVQRAYPEYPTAPPYLENQQPAYPQSELHGYMPFSQMPMYPGHADQPSSIQSYYVSGASNLQTPKNNPFVKTEAESFFGS